MKLSFALGFTVAALHSGQCFAKKYYNEQILKDKTGLLGHRVKSYIYESPEAEDATHNNGRHLKGSATAKRMRRTQEDVPDSFEEEALGPSENSEDTAVEGTDEITDEVNDVEDGTDDGIDEDDLQFYQAESLDFFKNGIDPEFFEWVNPDEIAPNATTCGFLKPDLGSLDDVIFPVIEVYVCARFATTQPAAKGNVFVHCGGPSSLSDCLDLIPISIGEQNLNDYNFLSIDQVREMRNQ